VPLQFGGTAPLASLFQSLAIRNHAVLSAALDARVASARDEPKVRYYPIIGSLFAMRHSVNRAGLSNVRASTASSF
jgi:hypothetical protein